VSGEDHHSFIDVAGCDLIDFDIPYWHTTRDTPDGVDPGRMAIVGHVLVESLSDVEKKFH
jgi:hypothetical protein